MKKKSIWISGSVLLTIPAITILVWFTLQKHPKYNGPIDKIILGSTPAYYSLLILVAQEQGYFDENGLDVTLNLSEIGSEALNKLRQGKIDFATSSEFGFVNESLKEGSENLRIIASLAKSFSTKVVARRDHGIQKPADLKGKRVGIWRDSPLDFSFNRYLIFQGISPEEITFINLSYNQSLEAILKGEIDATILFDIRLFKALKQLGANAVSWYGRSTQDFYWLLVGKAEFIVTKPDVVERLLIALLEAQEFVRNHPHEAEVVYIRHWKYDSEFVQFVREMSTFEISLDQSLIVVMEDEADWRIKSSRTWKKKIPNYLRHIYMAALDRVKPTANTIYR